MCDKKVFHRDCQGKKFFSNIFIIIIVNNKLKIDIKL
jgi:hypothetical protein